MPAPKWLGHLPLLRGLRLSDEDCSLLQSETAPRPNEPMFVVVHGTWATGATWTDSASPLVQALGSVERPAAVFRFHWSGTNGVRHRLRAADLLAKGLDELSSKHDNSPIVLISHSHGGNVAAWASTKVGDPIHASVYLNTPFIQAVGAEGTSAYLLRRFLLGAVPLIVVVALQAEKRVPLWFLTLSAALMIGAALLGAWLLPAPVVKLRQELARVVNAKRRLGNELVVNIVGDEAAAALGGVFFAQWLLRRLFIYLFLIQGVTYTIGFLVRDVLHRQTRLIQIALDLMTANSVVLMLSAVLAIAAHGVFQGLIGLDWSITISPAPVNKDATGAIDVTTIGWTNSDTGLRHSQLHQSVEVGGLINEWLIKLRANDLSSRTDSNRRIEM